MITISCVPSAAEIVVGAIFDKIVVRNMTELPVLSNRSFMINPVYHDWIYEKIKQGVGDQSADNHNS
jgi:hypothetical protein